MNWTPEPPLPRWDDLVIAARRLDGNAVVTPLLESPLLNERLGGRVLIKAEMLQRTGSFKFRGAFNRISDIPSEMRARGVVAFSSGNHAQGVAAAARELGLTATIVMPDDAPRLKLRNTRDWGAEVVTYDRRRESREEIGARIATATGATLVRPYDDAGVIAGQGTIGMEIVRQAAAMGATVDTLLCPVGGGGLIAGIGLALSVLSPQTRIYGVEPMGFDDTGRSLKTGHRVENDPDAVSICDALLAPTPGELTFALNRRQLSGGLTVTDDAVRRAVATAFDLFKIVSEPGGAVALAALLSGDVETRGRTVAVVCSGGNVDPEMFKVCLDRA